MNQVKKYIKIIIGCLLISLGVNLFIIPSKLVASGIIGISNILNYDYGLNIPVLIFIINFWTLWLVYMVYDIKGLKKYLLPSLLIPLLIYLTSFIHINLSNEVEELLIALFGGLIMGYGYAFLYKEGYKVGSINILEDMFNDFNEKNTRWISRGFDFLLIFLTLQNYGLEQTLYSVIVIVIIRYLTTKATIGISDSKAFYIITTKEKDVRRYLLEELKYDFTVFDVEGGYSKRKNKIIMTVIPTKDYFRLKEGIKLIDKNAFISITDNYEVLNKDVEISAEE